MRWLQFDRRISEFDIVSKLGTTTGSNLDKLEEVTLLEAFPARVFTIDVNLDTPGLEIGELTNLRSALQAGPVGQVEQLGPV